MTTVVKIYGFIGLCTFVTFRNLTPDLQKFYLKIFDTSLTFVTLVTENYSYAKCPEKELFLSQLNVNVNFCEEFMLNC